MGGVFGVVSKNDCVMDIFFGTDYHSHLGTKNGGMCILQEDGFHRTIRSIANSPFRGKFEDELDSMVGNYGIGAISDGDPQPLTVKNKFGNWAITTVGRINNKDELVNWLINESNAHFMSKSGGDVNNTELVGAIVSTGKDITDGIRIAQEKVDGSVTMLVLTEDGMYAARDRYGRTPLILGKKEGAYCAASESFAFINIGYEYDRELGPGEIAFLTPDSEKTVKPANDKMRICTFLWSYFGYTTSIYEGQNVELMRNRNGGLMAKADKEAGMPEVDYVAGVPDSGTAHAVGYANAKGIPFTRPFIKYTPTWPRSFMPTNQSQRNMIAKMKLIPVKELIKDKSLLLIDDSIVRGTQLGETTDFLYDSGAKEVHVRPACPPIMFGCKYLNFSRSSSEMDLITRRVIHKLEGDNVSEETLKEYANPDSEKYQNMLEEIRKRSGFTSLRYHRLDDMVKSIGLEKCKLCTYCFDGEE